MLRARTGIVIAAVVLGAAFAGCASGDPASTSKPPVPPAATGPGWKVVPTGPVFEHSGLNDIDILDAENIWVASENVPEEDDSSFVARWDGRQFVKLARGPDEFLISYQVDLQVVGPDDIWATGDGTLWQWDGSTWHKVVIPSVQDYWFDSVVAVAKDDVWAIGGSRVDSRGKVHDLSPHVYHWDGEQWQRFTIRTPGGDLCLDRLEAVAENDVWAFGSGTCGSAAHWDGTAWTEVAMPNVGSLEDVAAVGRGDIWVIGGDADGQRPFVLHWDGAGWDSVTLPSPRRYLSAIAGDGAGGVWITGQRGSDPFGPTYFLHRDRAGRWTDHKDPSGEHGVVEDMELVPGTRTLWAVGGQGAWPVSGTSLVERYDPPSR